MTDFTKTIALLDDQIADVLRKGAPASNKDEGIDSFAYYEDLPNEDKARIEVLLDRRISLMGGGRSADSQLV